MAVSREPILKRCRYLGISPMVMGISKESNRNPGANNRKKLSEYGMQLKEKQKLKFIYALAKSSSITTLKSLPRWKVRLVTTWLPVWKADWILLFSVWVWL